VSIRKSIFVAAIGLCLIASEVRLVAEVTNKIIYAENRKLAWVSEERWKQEETELRIRSENHLVQEDLPKGISAFVYADWHVPGLLRDMAIASARDERLLQLLERHGFYVDRGAGSNLLAHPDRLLRDLAIASLKSDRIYQLLEKHGYHVQRANPKPRTPEPWSSSVPSRCFF